jgi:CheY-like chemotaxis protein
MGEGQRPALQTASLLARKGAAAPSFAADHPVPAQKPVATTIAMRPAVVSPIRPAASAPSPERSRVVVVAADFLGRKLLRALVAAHGCEVAMLGPAESPFAHVLRSRPELVVIDLDIGRLAARDLAVRIKADPELRATSVVAATDPDTPTVFGYDAILAKPLCARDVARALGRLARLGSFAG